MTLVTFILILCAGALGYLLGAKRRAPAPAVKPPAATAPSTEPSADLSSRLSPLRATIDGFGESSAHPREIAERTEFKQAVALLADPAISLDVVTDYALGANWALSCVGLAALAVRDDKQAALAVILPQFARVSPWALHFALAYFEAVPQRPALGAPLLFVNEHAPDHGLVPGMFTAHFKRRESLGDKPSFGDALAAGTAIAPACEELLRKIDHPFARTLLAEVAAWNARRIDTEYLKTIGRIWSREADPLLIEFGAIDESLQSIETAITHVPARSVLIVGEQRSGKSALARLAGARLAERGYVVFEASGPELMAGQKYIGELEGRIRRLVVELATNKRVIWYVPDLLQILFSGSHSGQAAGILEQITPDVAAGRLIIISECTPGGLTRALQHRPVLRSAFDIVRLRTLSSDETRGLMDEFLRRVSSLLEIGIEPGLAATVSQLARHYLGGMQMPGAELDLIKLACNRAVANHEATISRGSLLATLSQLTGLPRAVLDDSEKMDLTVIRAFFAARVIGQDEAVGAVVDRIAMFKAGLTDPGRPIAVFLFAGPTGTGKTELAKTLADYLFGTAERLLRLDMSEFQNSASVEKIIGAAVHESDSQSLIQRVRKQPFAVILLDEFEKAHANVWDLFLQVFDDGRLTDSSGQTVDFRHTLVILTSNLGATTHQSMGVGFAPRSDAFSQEQVKRAVAQNFRPEFVNRLDKVIVFRPLTRDRMRSILRKELVRVLERRGLQNREWAVEWESSALEFLLEKGFTTDMGARPLKRAIDQFLLAPLAATMVERRFPVGDQFLFVRSDGEAIQVEFVDPNSDLGASAPASPPDIAAAQPDAIVAAVAQPAGTRAEREQLNSGLARIEQLLAGAEWEALSDALTTQMADGRFWDRPDRQRVLARYALMDRVRAACGTARALSERHGRGLRSRAGQYSRELAARFALQLLLLERGVRDALTDAPIEVVLLVEPAMDGGGDAEQTSRWCTRIHEMYDGWATRRRMQAMGRELAGGKALIVTGFGAHSVLSREAGLHVLESDETRRSIARVRVAPLWSTANAAEIAVAEIDKVLAAAVPQSVIVRRYRVEPSPLVRDAERGWRTGRLDDVMRGDFDLF